MVCPVELYQRDRNGSKVEKLMQDLTYLLKQDLVPWMIFLDIFISSIVMKVWTNRHFFLLLLSFWGWKSVFSFFVVPGINLHIPRFLDNLFLVTQIGPRTAENYFFFLSSIFLLKSSQLTSSPNLREKKRYHNRSRGCLKIFQYNC